MNNWKTIGFLFTLAFSTFSFGGEYTYTAEYSEAGTYVIDQPGTDVTFSGEIDGEIAVTLPENCRVTLSGIKLAGTLTIIGDAEIRLVGDNDVSTSGASALVCSGALTLTGDGTLAAAAAGAKKTGVISAGDLLVAGGTTAITIVNPTKKNACGVSLSGNYAQSDGVLKIVGESGDVKQNGVFLSEKNTTAVISGGTLDVSLAGEKSVGLALDKESASGTMTGGALKFTMTGDGAKGIKGDGVFTMTGGDLDATLTGGIVEDCFEYEDGDGNTWNAYVTLTSSTKTSGGTATYSTSSLIAAGTYPVIDAAKSYAVKVGTLAISGGTVKITATGTAGRGLGADAMTLSGGTYDIAVSGGPTDVYVESLVDADDLTDSTFLNGVATCLDSGAAACIKTGDEQGTLTISGGTFNLKATGNAGKLINAGGYLVIGTEGATTLPTDSSFSPDITGSTTGAKVYCTAVKQKYYGTLATAAMTTNLSEMVLSVANDNLVQSAQGQTGAQLDGMQGGGPGGTDGPGGTGGPGGTDGPGGGMQGGGDDDADYSNPKGIKAVSGITVHGGRITVTTKNDGGEGLESKDLLTINGGVLDLQCYDDAINSGGNLIINGGYIYAGSSGNDAVDSNAKIYMTGGVLMAISTAGAPEVGIDTDDSGGLVISGGHLIAVGGASENMVIGSSGTQKTYRNVSASASTYSGKYLSVRGSQTFTMKMPTLSGTISLVCTTEGWTSAGTPSVSTTAPSTGALGFHDAYLSGYTGASSDGENSGESAGAATGAVSSAYSLFESDSSPVLTSAVSKYNGYVMNGGKIAGTFALKVGRANSKTGIAVFSGTVQLLGAKKATYAAKAVVASSAPTSVTLRGKGSASGSTMAVVVAGDFLSGTIQGKEMSGARNMSGAKETRRGEYTAKQGTIYNAVLEGSDAVGAGAASANGWSALCVKLLSKGKAKLTGVMADGTKVSSTGLQLLLSQDGTFSCLPICAPMYRNKLGGFGFLLWLGSDGTTEVTDLSDWDATRSTKAKFSATLSCVGSSAKRAPQDGTLRFQIDPDSFPDTISGLPVNKGLLDAEVFIAASSGKLSARSGNALKLNVSRTASTGLFKGSFKVFLQNGTRVKSKSVGFNGTFINGTGYGAAVIKGVCSVPVLLQ